VNPELRRNLWLEIGTQRLVAMPVVLVLVFALAYLLADTVADGWHAVAVSAAVAYGFATLLWGTHMAGDAVLGEVATRTWDWQRMSSIGPWTMTWGKLFGSTAYAWYGATICLPIFVFASLDDPKIDTSWWLGMLLAAAVLAHAVGLIWSLLLTRNQGARGQLGQRRSSAYLLLLLILLVVLPWISGPFQELATWYGRVETGRGFALVSLALFAGWAVVGAYRLMRIELQFRNRPWVWLGFCAFLMGYFAGFVPVGMRLFTGYSIAMLLTLVAAFTTPRDLLQLRRLGRAVEGRDLATVLQQTPPWLSSLLLAGLVGMAVLVTPTVICQGPFCIDGFALESLVVIAMFFLLRDLGILWLVSLGGRSRRPELAAVVYLIVLYSILPGVMGALGIDAGLALLLPRPDLAPAWGILAAVPGPLVVGVLLWRQARRRAGDPQLAVGGREAPGTRR
jgi:hypothetical protein